MQPRTLFPDLRLAVSKERALEETGDDAPIPMTGPYFAFASSSAFTARGHTRRSARHATKKSESDDARRRDCAREGLRANRDIAASVFSTQQIEKERRA